MWSTGVRAIASGWGLLSRTTRWVVQPRGGDGGRRITYSLSMVRGQYQWGARVSGHDDNATSILVLGVCDNGDNMHVDEALEVRGPKEGQEIR